MNATKKTMERLPKSLIDFIEEKSPEFTIRDYPEEKYCEIGRYTSEGQDFYFVVNYGGDLEKFVSNIWEYYDNYDPSEEASLWLDEMGHGKNGAPYEMVDVYNDTKECKGFISEFYSLVEDFIKQEKEG